MRHRSIVAGRFRQSGNGGRDMGRKKISLAALSYDRCRLTVEESALLEIVLMKARRAVLSYPADHVLSRAGQRTLAAWGEPAPRKRGYAGNIRR